MKVKIKTNNTTIWKIIMPNKKEFVKGIQDINATIDRIPKDLVFWEKEIKRLKNKKDKKSKLIVKEYTGFFNFYVGKILAYLYLMEIFNKGSIKISKESLKVIRIICKNTKPCIEKNNKNAKK